jgi:GIY-YIG catalytic domain
MAQHAFVTWVEADAPWEIENKLLSSGPPLPLNVDGNASKEAAAILSDVRLKARRAADQFEIVTDNGGRRRPPRIAPILKA